MHHIYIWVGDQFPEIVISLHVLTEFLFCQVNRLRQMVAVHVAESHKAAVLVACEVV